MASKGPAREPKELPEPVEKRDGKSMVLGVPGKVVRQLDEVMIDGLLKSAENYQANAIRFMKSLDIVEG